MNTSQFTFVAFSLMVPALLCGASVNASADDGVDPMVLHLQMGETFHPDRITSAKLELSIDYPCTDDPHVPRTWILAYNGSLFRGQHIQEITDDVVRKLPANVEFLPWSACTVVCDGQTVQWFSEGRSEKDGPLMDRTVHVLYDSERYTPPPYAKFLQYCRYIGYREDPLYQRFSPTGVEETRDSFVVTYQASDPKSAYSAITYVVAYGKAFLPDAVPLEVTTARVDTGYWRREEFVDWKLSQDLYVPGEVYIYKSNVCGGESPAEIVRVNVAELNPASLSTDLFAVRIPPGAIVRDLRDGRSEPLTYENP